MADREDLDELLADMAGHQAAFRGEVTAEANRALAQPVFERLERQAADAKAAPPPCVVDVPERPTRETREVDGRRYTLTRAPDTDEGVIDVRGNAHAMWLFERASARLQLLLTKPESGPLGAPSWRARALAWLALVAGKQPTKRSLGELLALCDESVRYFGDWKQDAALPVHFDLGGNQPLR